MTKVLALAEVAIIFEPRDIWVGVYIDKRQIDWRHIYVTLIPMFPIRITIQDRQSC